MPDAAIEPSPLIAALEAADELTGPQLEQLAEHAIRLAMHKAADDLARPNQVLDVKPKIAVYENAETAFRELGWTHAVTATVSAVAQRMMSATQAAIAKAAGYPEHGERVPVADRRKSLEEELLRWGDKNRATLCPGKAKTATFEHGVIRWRSRPASVGVVKDVETAEVKKQIAQLPLTVNVALDAETPLNVALARLFDSLGYRDTFTITLGVDKKAALKALTNETITAEQLAAIDHELRPASEDVEVLPAEFVRT